MKSISNSPMYNNTIRFLLIISLLFSVLIILDQTKPSVPYFPTNDELNTSLAVEKIDEFGIPVISLSKESPQYISEFEVFFYYKYLMECYLRYPFYKLSQIVDYNWGTVSSIFYLFILQIISVFYLVYTKNDELAGPVLFFFILLASSLWVTSVFRITRYLSFTVLSISIVHIVILNLYNNKLSNKQLIFIIWLSFIPTLFHILNIVIFFFWILVIFVQKGKLLVQKEKDQIKKLFTKSNIIITTSIMVLFSVSFFLVILYYNSNWLVFFDPENRIIWLQYLRVNVAQHLINYLIIGFLITVAIIFRNKLTKFEKNTIIFSIMLTLFELILFTVVSGHKIKTFSYKYLIHTHPIYLFFVSVLLNFLLKLIANTIYSLKLKFLVNFLLVVIIVTILIAPFRTGIYKFNEELDKKYFEDTFIELKKIINENQNSNTIVICSRSVEIYYLFPDFKGTVYTFRQYPEEMTSRDESLTNWLKSGRYSFVKYNDYVIDMFYQYRIGSKKDFVKLLEENSEKTIVLFNIARNDFALNQELREVLNFMGRERLKVITAKDLLNDYQHHFQ
jgi:hypothetical protein